MPATCLPLEMDHSFDTFITGNQSSLGRFSLNLSLNILDDTMPDLLDTTVQESQPLRGEMTKSRIETEEFVRNEAVINLIEEILDDVEKDPPVNEVQVTDESKSAAAPLEFILPIDGKAVEANDSEQSDLDDDEYMTKCSKRQMNESIMSIGDPMIAESKKLKNQLDKSIMEYDEDTITETQTMTMATNFNLSDLIEELEDKENLDPKSPNVSGCSLTNAQRLSISNSNAADALMQFNSPVDEMQQEPSEAAVQEEPTIHSPKRPVFSELKADLFGIIYPNDTDESPKNTKASDLLSVSIFQTSPVLAQFAYVDVPTDQNLMDISIKEASMKASAQNVLLNKEDSSHMLNALIVDTKETDSNNTLNDSSADSSIISTHMLFNQSTQSTKRLSAVHEESHAVANNSMNESCSAEGSIISTNLLFNQSRQSLEPSSELSVTAANKSLQEESSILSTSLLFNQSLNQSLNRSQMEANKSSDNTLHLSTIDSSNMAATEIDEQESISYDNFKSEVKDRIQEMSFIEEEFQLSETLLMDEPIQTDNVDSGAPSLSPDESCPSSHDDDDDVSLLETKLVYESKIVELNARIEQLEEQLTKKQQTTAVEEVETSIEPDETAQSPAEVTFSMEDRVNLIKTKLDYDVMIVDLMERIELLEAEVAAEAQSAQLKLANAKAECESKDAGLCQLRNQLESSDTKQATLESQLEESNNKLGQLSADNESLQSEVTALNQELLTIKSRLDETKQEIDETRELCLSKETELIAAIRENEKLNERLVKLSGHSDELQTELNQKQAQFENFEQMKKSLKVKHESALCELKQQITSLNDVIRGLEQKSAKLEEEKNSLEDSIRYKYELTLVPEHQNLKQQYTELSLKHLESANENQMLMETISEMDQQRNDLRLKVEKFNEQLVTLSRHNDEIGAELNQKQTQLENLRQLHQSSKVEHESAFGQLTQQITSLNDAIRGLELKYSQLEEEKSSLEDTVRVKEQTMVVLENTRTENESKMVEYERIIVNIRSELSTTESRVTELVEEVEAVNMLNENYVSENSDLMEEKSKMLSTIEQLNRQLADQTNSAELMAKLSADFETEKAQMMDSHNREVDLLKQKIAQFEVDNQKLSADLSALDITCSNLKSENESLKSKSDEKYLQEREESALLTAQLQSAQSKLESVQIELASAKAECESKDAGLCQLRNQLESSDTKQAALESQLEESNNKLGQLSADNESLQSEVTALNQELLTIKSRLDETKQEIDKTRELRVSKETELTAAIRENEKLNERLVKLSGHNDELRAELNQKQTQFENFEQMKKSLKVKHESALCELKQQITSLNDVIRGLEQKSAQLEEEKNSLEDSLSKAQDKLLTEATAKNSLNQKLNVAYERIGKIKEIERQSSIQYNALKGLPVREKLSESVKANQKLIGSINKLIEQMKTDKSFEESVKTDLVKKILYTIREKLNASVKETSKVLGEPVKVSDTH